MKKIIIAILLITMIMIPLNVMADEVTITYAEAQNMLKETMKAYYMRGPNIQYNYARATYGTSAPEEMTSQDGGYLVCASYAFSTYFETFGVINSEDTAKNNILLPKSGVNRAFPKYATDIVTAAGSYYNKNKTNGKLNGNYLIYYENKGSKIDYKYSPDEKNYDSVTNFAELIKPGDIFFYTGHIFIAYDKVKNNVTGENDILLLHSYPYPDILYPKHPIIKIDSLKDAGTSRIFYNIFQTTKPIKNYSQYLDIPTEGTILVTYLSNLTKTIVSKDGKNLNCQQKECGVIRAFYNDEGKANFNFNIDKNKVEEKLKNSKFRTAYPGIYVEKTVDKGDNDSVYLEDELTYTIKITNKSSINGSNTNYKMFYVEEEFGDSVEFLSSSWKGDVSKINMNDQNAIKWGINGLAPNATVTVTYKVKVKKDQSKINSLITSKGKIYDSNNKNFITTGTVKNKIISKATGKKSTYASCYNKSKKTGLQMIDEVYDCMYENQFNFSTFKFADIFTKNTKPTSTTSSQLIYPKNTENIFYKMILNNYWSGLVVPTSGNHKGKIIFPRWSGTYTKDRAKNINYSDFKDGDILIYKNLNDATNYVYIYINGEFKGKNSSGSTIKFTYENYSPTYSNLYGSSEKLDASNKTEVLTYANYQTLFGKEYYVILRPEQLVNSSMSNKKTFEPNDINLETSNGIKPIVFISVGLVIITGIITLIVYTIIKKKKTQNI